MNSSKCIGKFVYKVSRGHWDEAQQDEMWFVVSHRRPLQ